MENQDIYTRQAEFLACLPSPVICVGVGGVGMWAAYFAALAGVSELELWDCDTVSGTNLNRLPLSPADVGSLKVRVAGNLILRARPNCRIRSYSHRWSPELANVAQEVSGKSPAAVIVSTDQARVRSQVHAHYAGIPVIDAGAERECATCTPAPATFEDPQTGYLTIPVWCGSAVMAATLAVYRLVHPSGHPVMSVAEDGTMLFDWTGAQATSAGIQGVQ